VRSLPLFADDNSAARRAARRAQREAAERDARRNAILATLRRLKEQAVDREGEARRERARRHAELLQRYPPLY
jgi:hypothetical protein